MRHRRPLAALGFFHQKEQRKHDQKHPSEDAKHVVVGEHVSLLLDHTPKCGLSTMGGSNCVHAFSNEGLAKALERLLGAKAGFGHMLSKIVDMYLGVPKLQRF